MNESTLEEVYHIRLSALGLSVITILLIIVSILIFSSIILFTPLKGFLPENVDDNLRDQVAVEALQIDSLTEVVELQGRYIETLKGIMAGTIKVDTANVDFTDSKILAVQPQQFMEKSDEEKEFVRNYEDDEKFNLMSASPEPKGLLFQHPVNGVITSQLSLDNSCYGIEVSTLPHASVKAVYQGVVFNAGYDFNTGYFVEIVHQQNFISIYRQLAGIYVKKGDYVKTGQVIGTMFNGDKGSDKHILHFELWNENVAQNPLDYMVFE